MQLRGLLLPTCGSHSPPQPACRPPFSSFSARGLSSPLASVTTEPSLQAQPSAGAEQDSHLIPLSVSLSLSLSLSQIPRTPGTKKRYSSFKRTPIIKPHHSPLAEKNSKAANQAQAQTEHARDPLLRIDISITSHSLGFLLQKSGLMRGILALLTPVVISRRGNQCPDHTPL